MAQLEEVGTRDGWRCWLCDTPVDPDANVNSDLGPSVDAGAPAKNKKAPAPRPRLAHRACNTRKGAVAAVVAWDPDLFVLDPAPIVAVTERLLRKGGREVVARCPTRDDAERAGAWLLDRLSRLEPELPLTTSIAEGGGQYLLAVQRR